MSKIRVMLVDDSAIVRGMIQRALGPVENIEVVSTASDGQMAIDMLKRTPADIIVLDIEMPVMDGLTALPQLLQIAPQAKVIMASTLTLRNADISMKALALGATDYLPKPSAATSNEAQEFYRALIEKIQGLAPKNLPTAAAAPLPNVAPVTASATFSEALGAVPRVQAVAIASSTGGPQALISVFTALKGKALTVPIFITQHMPPSFTTILADHISKALGADCHEARDDEEPRAGQVYLAPGDFHMTVVRSGPAVKIKLNKNPPENFCRPAADPMLRSLAPIYGKNLLAVVLTGMGSDGALGAADVVRQGGTVAAQNEATCIVYGMPKAVVDAKLAKAVLPLDQIAPYIAKAMGV